MKEKKEDLREKMKSVISEIKTDAKEGLKLFKYELNLAIVFCDTLTGGKTRPEDIAKRLKDAICENNGQVTLKKAKPIGICDEDGVEYLGNSINFKTERGRCHFVVCDPADEEVSNYFEFEPLDEESVDLAYTAALHFDVMDLTHIYRLELNDNTEDELKIIKRNDAIIKLRNGEYEEEKNGFYKVGGIWYHPEADVVADEVGDVYGEYTEFEYDGEKKHLRYNSITDTLKVF